MDYISLLLAGWKKDAFKEVEPSSDHGLLVSFSYVEAMVESDCCHWGEMDSDITYVVLRVEMAWWWSYIYVNLKGC